MDPENPATSVTHTVGKVAEGAGVVVGEPAPVVEGVLALLAEHRAWARPAGG
jgi:hypothetical protein